MRTMFTAAIVVLAAHTAQAQLPPDSVQLDKVKISEAVKSADLDPVTLQPADPALGTFEYDGVTYGMSDAASKTAFLKSPELFAEKAAKARWEQNFIKSMSLIWCPVTDEISPGGNTKWEKLDLTWESCCQFCNDTVQDSDFDNGLARLKIRATKSWDAMGGHAKYTEGAKSPVEGAIDLTGGAGTTTAAAAEPAGAGDLVPAPAFEPAYLKGLDLQPTYAGGIAKIVEQRCLECHRDGGISPMTLKSLGEIRKWQKNLKTHIELNTMPPWPASPDVAYATGKNLTPKEKETFLAWIESGYAPGEGDAATAVPGEWLIGEPDKVIQLDEYTIPENDADHLRTAEVDPGVTEDTWVVAAEIQSDAYLVLEVNGGPLGAYHKGQTVTHLPEGYGFKLKKGEKVPVRVFYTKEKGWEETDSMTRIGVKFAADPASIKKQVLTDRLANDNFTIPAGADSTSVTATFEFPADGEILGLNPVLRLRGKSLSAVAKFPDGKQMRLLDIPRWDNNYHFQYQLGAPVPAPKGTKIEVTAVYDNSQMNAANPDPTAEVKAGPGGELLEGWLLYALTGSAATKTAEAATHCTACDACVAAGQ